MFFNIVLKCLYLITLVQAAPVLIDVDVNVQLDSAGFHRSLITNITFYGNLSSCFFLTQIKLNNHVYVDSNELETLKQNGKLLTRLDSKIDTESPAERAKPFNVYVYLTSRLTESSPEYHSTVLHILPIHIRYHNPEPKGEYTSFNISYPTIYITCTSEEQMPVYKGGITFPCSSVSSNMCNWVLLSVKKKNDRVEVTIPIGNTDLSKPILISTHLIAIVSVLYVIYTLFKTPIQ